VSAQRRIGVMFPAKWPAEELPAVARDAELHGFHELWLAEDCFEAGGLTMATAALASTERLAVGIGLLPAAVRNAAITAMEIAALGRLYPERFIAGFGHGVESWMRQIGARPARRLAALEETVAAVRRLIAGEELSVDGSFVTLDAVRLDQHPSLPPPVLVGTTGPRGLAIAGRAADGILLPEGSGPASIRWARAEAAAAGPGTATVVYAWLRVDDDGAAALEAMRPAVESWARGGLYPHLTEQAGLGRDGAGALTADVLREVCVAGTPAECAAAIEALWDAGADSVALLPATEDRAEQLARAAGEVLPRLGR
jgi:5,10-methylenetetrahydromethanopterin reductase